MFHVKTKEKAMTLNETSFSEETEARARDRGASLDRAKDSLRKSRRDRVVAGKADAFDCTSEEDVVCPHCGAWFDGSLELGECIVDWQKQPDKLWHRVPCQHCEEPFDLRVEVKLTFSTLRREGS